MLPVLTARAPALLCPANLAPLAARNVVVVIHDAAPLRHPGWYSGTYAAVQRRLLPLIARRARRVITVSEFSKRELAELLGVEAEVVPGGVDARFAPQEQPRVTGRTCSPSPRTRRARTCRALVPAAQALARDGVELLVAGGHRPQFAAEADLTGLTLLGHVPDDELPGLYAGAEAFVLPSVYEGFGLPVLEAMASGTPVVAADTTALPETCGGAARLVAPEPEALRDALTQLLRATSEPAARAGCASARHWERTARESTRRASPWDAAPRAQVRRDVRSGRGDDAAQRRREAQLVQARLGRRLDRRTRAPRRRPRRRPVLRAGRSASRPRSPARPARRRG